MGHLTRIANAVVQNLEGGPLQSQVSEIFQGERLQARVSLPTVPPAVWPSAGGTGPAAGRSACLLRADLPSGLGLSLFPAEPCTPACAVPKSSLEPCGAPLHRGLWPLHLGLPRAPCVSQTLLCPSQHHTSWAELGGPEGVQMGEARQLGLLGRRTAPPEQWVPAGACTRGLGASAHEPGSRPEGGRGTAQRAGR